MKTVAASFESGSGAFTRYTKTSGRWLEDAVHPRPTGGLQWFRWPYYMADTM